MEQLQPRGPLGRSADDRTLRRIITVAGIVLVAAVLAAVAIYAAAFLMLAPMMQ